MAYLIFIIGPFNAINILIFGPTVWWVISPPSPFTQSHLEKEIMLVYQKMFPWIGASVSTVLLYHGLWLFVMNRWCPNKLLISFDCIYFMVHSFIVVPQTLCLSFEHFCFQLWQIIHVSICVSFFLINHLKHSWNFDLFYSFKIENSYSWLRMWSMQGNDCTHLFLCMFLPHTFSVDCDVLFHICQM